MRLAWKTWCETRARFALSLATLLVAELATVGRPGDAGRLWRGAYGESMVTLFVLLVVTLGGGSLRQEGALGTLGFTLALPVGRTRLVVARAATGLAEVVALVVLVTLELLVLARSGATGVRPSWLLAMALPWAACGALLLALSLFLSSLFESEYVAWLAAFVAFLGYEALVNLTALRAYPGLDLYRLLGGASVLAGGLPWRALAVVVATTLALVAASVLQLRRSAP